MSKVILTYNPQPKIERQSDRQAPFAANEFWPPNVGPGRQKKERALPAGEGMSTEQALELAHLVLSFEAENAPQGSDWQKDCTRAAGHLAQLKREKSFITR